MVSPDGTVLTERQVEVLELRREGYTQREIAEVLGTTDANISAVERAAEENVKKARRTLELMGTLAAPVRITVDPDTSFEQVVDEIYSTGDKTGTKIDYCRPELYAHLYGMMKEHADRNLIRDRLAVGITHDGDVKVYQDSG